MCVFIGSLKEADDRLIEPRQRRPIEMPRVITWCIRAEVRHVVPMAEPSQT